MIPRDQPGENEGVDGTLDGTCSAAEAGFNTKSNISSRQLIEVVSSTEQL